MSGAYFIENDSASKAYGTDPDGNGPFALKVLFRLSFKGQKLIKSSQLMSPQPKRRVHNQWPDGCDRGQDCSDRGQRSGREDSYITDD